MCEHHFVGEELKLSNLEDTEPQNELARMEQLQCAFAGALLVGPAFCGSCDLTGQGFETPVSCKLWLIWLSQSFPVWSHPKAAALTKRRGTVHISLGFGRFLKTFWFEKKATSKWPSYPEAGRLSCWVFTRMERKESCQPSPTRFGQQA